jgi:hypothetical protein
MRMESPRESLYEEMLKYVTVIVGFKSVISGKCVLAVN